MIHDEKTTEIELPWTKTKEDSLPPSSSSTHHRSPHSSSEKDETPGVHRIGQLVLLAENLDMNTPWVLRLLAVLAILLLSLLIV